jgi:malate/lactate dehydrogenase
MNKIIIVGFGNAGKHYFHILKKNKNINKIYIIEKKIPNKFKKYQTTIKDILKNIEE